MRGDREDRKYFWYCNVCDAQNSREDGECQYCECDGASCQRDNCSDPRHFAIEGKTMDYQVEMHAFGNGAIRTVKVPESAVTTGSEDEILGLVFHYGQNDFQPLPLPSVSVGDVIRLHGKRYRVAFLGFEALDNS